MVRRFDPDRPVSAERVRALVALAIRAPSAGFTQGWDFVALLAPEDRERFWKAADPADEHSEPDPWLRGVRAAPALLVCLSSPAAYLERYAAPDKGWTDRSLDHWPVPYWDTDTAMAAMLVLLGAVDSGLGALLFGVTAGRHDALKEALDIPGERRIVGVIALGHERERVTSPSLRRGRRSVDEVLGVGRFGASQSEPVRPLGEDG
jgi:nitroreductase